jgi:hypothetical protein
VIFLYIVNMSREQGPLGEVTLALHPKAGRMYPVDDLDVNDNADNTFGLKLAREHRDMKYSEDPGYEQDADRNFELVADDRRVHREMTVTDDPEDAADERELVRLLNDEAGLRWPASRYRQRAMTPWAVHNQSDVAARTSKSISRQETSKTNTRKT